MEKKAGSPKMIFFQERGFIESMVNDEALVFKRSGSSIFEQHLLSTLLPQNIAAIRFIRQLYSDDPPDLANAFCSIFNYFTVSGDGRTSLRPLVSFYHFLSIGVDTLTETITDWAPVTARMTCIAEILETTIVDDPQHKKELLNEAFEMRYFISCIEKHEHSIQFAPIICMLLCNWAHLVNHCCTYQLLSLIAKIQNGIRNDAETRYNLKRILKEISADWTDLVITANTL